MKNIIFYLNMTINYNLNVSNFDAYIRSEQGPGNKRLNIQILWQNTLSIIRNISLDVYVPSSYIIDTSIINRFGLLFWCTLKNFKLHQVISSITEHLWDFSEVNFEKKYLLNVVIIKDLRFFDSTRNASFKLKKKNSELKHWRFLTIIS